MELVNFIIGVALPNECEEKLANVNGDDAVEYVLAYVTAI
mgnify:CR=1 FL=1